MEARLSVLVVRKADLNGVGAKRTAAYDMGSDTGCVAAGCD